MRRLLLRVHLALALLLLVIAALLPLALPRTGPADLGSQIQHLAGLDPSTVAARFEGLEGDEALRAAEAALAGELGQRVDTLPREAVINTVGSVARRSLAEGAPVVQLVDAGPAIYVPLRDQDRVVVLRPGLRRGDRAGLVGLSVALLVLLGAGVAVYLIVRPVERQLEALAGAAKALGRGSFDDRVPVLRSDEVGRLAGAFNEMAERVQRMVEGRKELLDAVSHELRTPLSRLRFAVELLEAASSEEAREARIVEVLGDIEELENLVSELLQFSRLEAGGKGLACETVGLDDFVRGLAAEAARVDPGKRLELDLGPLGAAWGDRRLLARSLGNLLANAMRYANGRVRVTGRRVGTDPEAAVRIDIDDDGPGVPAGDRDRIFETFVRLDQARSRDTGGSGMGLSLARRALEAHGGVIRVEDSPLGGARFSWMLPCGDVGAEAEPPATPMG